MPESFSVPLELLARRVDEGEGFPFVPEPVGDNDEKEVCQDEDLTAVVGLVIFWVELVDSAVRMGDELVLTDIKISLVVRPVAAVV